MKRQLPGAPLPPALNTASLWPDRLQPARSLGAADRSGPLCSGKQSVDT